MQIFLWIRQYWSVVQFAIVCRQLCYSGLPSNQILASLQSWGWALHDKPPSVNRVIPGHTNQWTFQWTHQHFFPQLLCSNWSNDVQVYVWPSIVWRYSGIRQHWQHYMVPIDLYVILTSTTLTPSIVLCSNPTIRLVTSKEYDSEKKGSIASY